MRKKKDLIKNIIEDNNKKFNNIQFLKYLKIFGKGIWKLFQYFRVCVIQKNSNISYSHVSIAGECHLWKIVPKLISVGAIRFATDEILYHTKRSYFLVPLLHEVARVVFPPKSRKMPRCFLYRFCCRALFRSLRGGSVKRRASPWIRTERCEKREQPCFISRLQTSSLPRGRRRGPGDARANGARLSGIPGGAQDCNSSGGGGGGFPRIYTGYSPGQWSFRKPLIGPVARIVRE